MKVDSQLMYQDRTVTVLYSDITSHCDQLVISFAAEPIIQGKVTCGLPVMGVVLYFLEL